MILDKDNYELIMFDLLEGNLSEAEELLVMDQIEGDEFFLASGNFLKQPFLCRVPLLYLVARQVSIRKKKRLR
jgi:hypothetical protein